ncbi:hypothetical protein QN277_015007 [Acacia crassicarpa]|uniref:Transcription initiation factor IIA subunit 2 n=1 Tax=Acacia crassicarpa TaxID=499986 RepID=A0AAE1JZJ1_9FABA|nr:hypothetical protein QN277_015007 [Acacia crassicarpa]
MATFELYRRSTIGICLTDALDGMVQNGTLSPEHAIQVLVQFDKGHLHTYRFCDNVWTFILHKVFFKIDEREEEIAKLKIVACDSKLLSQ